MMTSFLHPGDPRIADVDAVRARIAELEAEIEHVERAPIPAAEFGPKLARVFVNEAVRDRVRHRLSRYRAPDQSPPLFSSTYDEASDVFELLAVLLEPEFVDRALRFLGADVDDERTGLPAADRARRAAELRDELQKLYLEEETRILELEQREGDVIVMRRADVDPRLVLRAWSTALRVESRAELSDPGGLQS